MNKLEPGQIPLLGASGSALDDGGIPLATIALRRPTDGVVTALIADSDAAAIDVAIARAKSAYEAHRKTPLHARIGWLEACANAVRSEAESLAQIVSEDVGKPIRAARFEAGRGAEFLRACAGTAPHVEGQVLNLDAASAGAGLTGSTRRIPYGVIAGVTPFNAPINLLLQKVAPAIAMGNAIVVKPALSGTRVAFRLAQLCVAAGLPDGLFTVVTGDKNAAITLVSHPDVRAVSFTGGTAAGNDLIRAAGAKKFVAELGSNAANVVFADADLPKVAAKLAAAGFEASGQQCISAQRILVERSVIARFLPLLVAAAQAMKVGAPDDPTTDVGPMVHVAAAERVMSMVADATERGAACALAPKRDGATVSPGILVDVPPQARLWREEVFGPIVLVAPFDTIEEALALANDSEFGLQGAVFTGSLAIAMRFADDFDVGSLWINEASRFRLDMYPFGGVKQSGVGREGVRSAMEELSQIKFVGIRPN